MMLTHYLGLLHRAELNLADALREVGDGHRGDVDVFYTCHNLAKECGSHADQLGPFIERYGEDSPDEPERLHSEIFHGTREGGVGLLRDLQDIYLMATECDITWTVVGQAAQGARDAELLEVVKRCESEAAIQVSWLRTRMKQAAPQALVVD